MFDLIYEGTSFRPAKDMDRLCVVTDNGLPKYVDVYTLDGSGSIRYVPSQENTISKEMVQCLDSSLV